ncbi:MAG: DNA-processing protein DprA [Chitinophagales bacterium]
MENELFYGIALSLLKGIGDTNAKTMISYAGSAEKLFKTPIQKLQKINGIGPKTAELFTDTYEALKRAEKELKFIEKNKIDVLFYYDKRYPKRLLNCNDAPLYLCCKGNYDFNKERFVSIIGTRNATEKGRQITEKLIEDFASYNINIVSGLAYGIDICAHKAALKHDLQNIAVLAHGLDRIYPNIHKNYVEKLQENGAIITDFLSETLPDRQNFPSRNRIVAGMTDATIVIESAVAGGALITAEIANSYNRDVFAFPGRVDDEYSIGCLNLVKKNKANLVTGAKDIIESMNWDLDEKPIPTKQKQPQLFIELSEKEQAVYDILKQTEKMHIDDICFHVSLTQSVVSGILLQLEMNGIILSLPGKMYKMN